MKTSRRSFLKIGGICALGIGSLPAIKSFAANQPEFKPYPNALIPKGQWAMVVDMKKCTEEGPKGCVDCIKACDDTHNIPDIPGPKEEIKWIWTESFESAFPGQDIANKEIRESKAVVLCNQCTNPPCVRVCPTQATWKRKVEDGGIVMMDYHRCIGCRYCMAACPYGSRSFNFRDPRPYIKHLNMDFPTRERGVVEKCNFCTERLAKGQLPACVDACKAKALTFGDLGDPNSPARKLIDKHFTLRRKAELGTGPNVYYII